MQEFQFLAADTKFAVSNITSDASNSLFDAFTQDRDHILYSKEFRRLSGKTQVFVVGFDDNMRNRLTHTLEVAEIAKTISDKLKLNLILTEAIAYGHDIGHTPFGHVGERTLHYITNGCDTIHKSIKINENSKGFKHNLQGVKVALKLERISKEYEGLNLTQMTLWGILNHTGKTHPSCKNYFKEVEEENKEDKTEKNYCSFIHNHTHCIQHVPGKQSMSYYNSYLSQIEDSAFSIEALVVKIADEIAQRQHDIEDGILADIISKQELIELFYAKFKTFGFGGKKASYLKFFEQLDSTAFIHSFTDKIKQFYFTQLIESTRTNLNTLIEKYNIVSNDDFHIKKQEISKKEDLFNLVNFNKEFVEFDDMIMNFLKERILNSHIAHRMDCKADHIIRSIFKAYNSNPTQLSDLTIKAFFKNFYVLDYEGNFNGIPEKSLPGVMRMKLKELQNRNGNDVYHSALIRTITDYIAGTTDSYALETYKKLYGFESIKY